MKRNFFAADPVYREQMESYTLKDTFAALGYWVLWMAVYYCLGLVKYRTGKYYGNIVNIAMMLLPVLLCVRKLSSLGLTGRNLKPSLLTGLAAGAVFLAAWTVIPGIVSGARLQPFGRILYNVFYYFVIIALTEEIGDRGVIQPRLYPLFRKEWAAVLAGGLLFVLMHLPYQMAARGMTLGEFLPQALANVPMQFIWHLVFTWIYRRHGNLAGAVVLHGFVDMSMGLFQ